VGRSDAGYIAVYPTRLRTLRTCFHYGVCETICLTQSPHGVTRRGYASPPPSQFPKFQLPIAYPLFSVFVDTSSISLSSVVMTEAQAAPRKLSLGRRLQRQTTKLFSWGHAGRGAPVSAPTGGTTYSSSSAASRPGNGPATAGERSTSHREASSKTLAIRNMRSRSVPRDDGEQQQQEEEQVDLSATKRVSDRAAAARTRKEEEEASDADDDTDTEDRSNQRVDSGSGPPRIGQQSMTKNRVRLLDVGYASVVGSQDHDNEDRLLLRSNEHFHLLSVMDGHGGELAGKFVVQRLFERLEAIYNAKGGFPDEPENDHALVRMMHELDDEFCAFARRRSDFSGVCVLAVILYYDALETQSARKIVLNLGDCRVILREAVEQQAARGALGARVIALSTDHCASNRVEKMRICENGGYVRYGRVAGLLEPSRSIGDIDMKEPEMKNWVIATPEIRRRTLAVGRSLLILATDGVWSVLPNDKVMTVALEALSAPRTKRRKGTNTATENAVRAIVEAARRKGSVDDVTVIVAIV
jgi:serine/threonine protein phosphatase PrpC